jgi:hypothetical protein
MITGLDRGAGLGRALEPTGLPPTGLMLWHNVEKRYHFLFFEYTETNQNKAQPIKKIPRPPKNIPVPSILSPPK